MFSPPKISAAIDSDSKDRSRRVMISALSETPRRLAARSRDARSGSFILVIRPTVADAFRRIFLFLSWPFFVPDSTKELIVSQVTLTSYSTLYSMSQRLPRLGAMERHEW